MSELHRDGYVHTGITISSLVHYRDTNYLLTDVKPNNVFVNYREGNARFSDVQLGDLGGTYPADSKWAKEGTPVGAPIWTSPEVIMETPWNTATDIWSFGSLVCLDSYHSTASYVANSFKVISLIYGGDFNLFRPRTVPYGHEEYGLEVLKRQFKYFGQLPAKYEEIASQETIAAILYLMEVIPQSDMTPFYRTTKREVSKDDKEFIGKIMQVDWRDRPTASELLNDRWFGDDNN